MRLNSVRDKVQKDILNSINYPSHGLFKVAPRVGKTKLTTEIIKKEKPKRILWVTPFTKLKEDIKSEFIKWKAMSYLDNLTLVTYASLHKVKGTFDKVILDEYQSCSINNTKGLFNGDIQYKTIIGLSGSHPEHREKLDIYNNLDLDIIYDLDIDKAIELGVLADYQINIIKCKLNSKDKSIKVGNKFNSFYTTEKSNYDYLTKQIEKDNHSNGVEYNLNNDCIKVLDINYILKEFNARFKCDEAYLILDKNLDSKGYIAINNEEIRGKIDLYDTFRIYNNDLIANVSKFHYLNRMRAIQNSKTKLDIAKKLISSLKGRKLVFSSNIEQAKELSEYTYHSKTNDKDLNKFYNEEIDTLACVNSGGIGFTFKNVDYFIITQVNSDKKGDILQKISRSLLLQENYKANIYIIVLEDTQDEVWLEKVLNKFDKNKIRYEYRY